MHGQFHGRHPNTSDYQLDGLYGKLCMESGMMQLSNAAMLAMQQAWTSTTGGQGTVTYYFAVVYDDKSNITMLSLRQYPARAQQRNR